MKVSIFNITFYIIIFFSVLNPILAGFFTEGIGLVYKTYTFILLMAAFLAVKKYRGNKLNNILLNPATCFLYYLIFQTTITVITAGNKLHNIVYELSTYLLPCLAILVVSILVSKYNDGKVCRLINFFIYAATLSLVVDALGYGDIFAGRYKEALLERFGVKQLHGFLPWPNAMATLLVVFGVIQQILKPKTVAYKIGYLSTIATLTRTYILASLVLLVTSIKGRGKKILVGALLFFLSYLSFGALKESTYELISPDTVYRLRYVWASFDVMNDYPIFGIGLGRLSDAAIWKNDKFSFHNHYGMPSELYTRAQGSWEMASSDTSLTIFAEIGFIGTLLLVLQLFWFIRIAIKTNSREFMLVLIPMAASFYSTAGMLFSFTFGVFYWFLYGMLISKYYDQNTTMPQPT